MKPFHCLVILIRSVYFLSRLPLLLPSRKDVAGGPADVVVTGGDSSLRVGTPRGELSLSLPAGVAFEHGSCIPTPAGEACGDELHFRFRIRVARSTDEGSILVRRQLRLRAKCLGKLLLATSLNWMETASRVHFFSLNPRKSSQHSLFI